MCVLAFQPVVLQYACCTCVIITDTLVVHNVTMGEEGGANLPKPVIDLN